MYTISNLLAKVLVGGFLCLSTSAVNGKNLNTNLKVKSDSSEQLNIEGTIFVENREIKGNYLIEVIYFDSVISTHKIKNNQAIEFHLKKNTAYTLRISKEGFVKREICLNTTLNENQKPASPFSFYIETEFIKVAEAMRMDDEALKLPIALIKYDVRNGNFISNKDYAIFVRQRLYINPNDLSLLSLKD